MYPAFPQPDHPTVDLVTDNAIMSQGMRNEISPLIRSELQNLLHPIFNEMNTKLEHISQHVVGEISESLPATTPAALAAFDKAIENNIHLQVCLVKFFANSHCLETVKTMNKAMSLIFGFVVADSAANKLQWKGSCRGKDKRPGLSPLLTVNAMLGVTLTTGWAKRSEMEAKSITVPQIASLIKKARTAAGARHRADSCEAADSGNSSDEAEERGSSTPSQSHIALSARIKLIMEAVRHFKKKLVKSGKL
ncbi:hypothetical protein GHT06_007640 [Daphnia sinensis]|uniref:Uncharacterized protein n=1 Tax=Daphnia sinensis TaxID=1820382 RepID=A0AAD5KVZ7_9CRUS|nr:hypothetical protein GHT06_007640 [Daphnia sinensis]